jgi:hypothetical protein
MKMNFYSVFRYVDESSAKTKTANKENTITAKNEIKEKNVNVKLLLGHYKQWD